MIGHLFSSVSVKVTMSNTRGSRWGSINRLSKEPEAALPLVPYTRPHAHQPHTHTSTLPPSPLTGLGQSVTTWHQAFHNILYTHSRRHVYTHAHTWHSSSHPSLQASANSLLQIMRHVAKQCSILHQPVVDTTECCRAIPLVVWLKLCGCNCAHFVHFLLNYKTIFACMQHDRRAECGSFRIHCAIFLKINPSPTEYIF